MFQRPRLKTYLTVFPISDTAWGVRGAADELWRVTFRSADAFGALTALLPMLNGAHTLETIVAEMASKGIRREAVERLLQTLIDSKLIEEAGSGDLSREEQERHASAIAYFSRYTSNGGSEYQARLQAARVALIAERELGDSLQRQLLEAGVQVIRLSDDVESSAGNGRGSREHDDGRVSIRALDRNTIWSGPDPLPQLVIVAQDTDRTDLLEAMDTFSKKHEIPWLLVRALEPTVGWVGPLFIPRDTACYLSLDARLRGNLPFFSLHQAFRAHIEEANVPATAYGGLRAFADLMASVATVEATKYLSGYAPPSLAGRFLTINFATWDAELHEVLRVPHIGLDATEPEIFAWKEVPSDAYAGHGFEELIARRS
jgi:bacteriocin biosynthesis cyclodehydratase domain-containing protein